MEENSIRAYMGKFEESGKKLGFYRSSPHADYLIGGLAT